MRAATQYAKWISGELPLPPLRVDASSFAASDRMLKELREARHLLVKDPSWDNFMVFVKKQTYLIELFTLHSPLIAHLPMEEAKTATQRLNRQFRSYERIMRQTANHPFIHILRGWVRRKRHPLAKSEKDMVVSFIDDIAAHKHATLFDPTEVLARQFFRRTQRVRSNLEQAPFVVPRAQVRLLPKELKVQCRQFAQSVNLDGYAVPPNRTLGYEIGSFFSDPSARRELGEYLVEHSETDHTTSQMIDLRTVRARKQSYNSFAHQQLDGAAVSSPRKAIGALAGALGKMGPAYSRLADAATRRMQKAGFEEANEMDIRHFLREAYEQTLSDPKGAFPIAATLRKAVPELLRCGGWKASRPRRVDGLTRGWAWSLTSEDGDKAELLVFPEAKFTPETGLADQTLVRGVLPPSGKTKGLAIINIYVEQATGYFSATDVCTLAHEIGHAIHGFVRPPNCLVEPMVATGADMLEFPSQLLELYARDPKVLAKWAKHSANPEFAKPSFWEKVLLLDQYGLPDHMRDLLSAWSDISLHAATHRHPVVSEHYARGVKRFGLPKDYAPEVPYLGFMWDSYAGYYFCYPMGATLARHLVMLHSMGSLPNSKDVARTFRSLHDNVLRHTEDTRSLRRLMSEWTGMEYGDLVSLAMDNYGKMMAREFRLATRAIKDLPPIEV